LGHWVKNFDPIQTLIYQGSKICVAGSDPTIANFKFQILPACRARNASQARLAMAGGPSPCLGIGGQEFKMNFEFRQLAD